MPTTLAFGFGGPPDFAVLLFVVLLVALPTVFWIVQLVDAARRQFPEPTVKIVWLLVIFLTHVLGAAVYYFVGKSQGTLPANKGLT